jgi:hypothetical protein
VRGVAVIVDVLVNVDVNVAIGTTSNASLQFTLVGNVVCLAPGNPKTLAVVWAVLFATG